MAVLPAVSPTIVETPSTPIIEEKIFGYSTAGRPITGYVVGSGEQTILLFSAIHANEKGTVTLLNNLVAEIKATPESVAKNKRLIIIPLLNPDGYYKRKDKLNANRVNLNLNFASNDWRKYAYGYFAGSVPFSEKESQLIRQVVEEYQPELMLAFHARGALVTPEAGKASIGWAKWYANKTGYQYYTEWNFPGTATKWFMQSTGYPAITIELTNYQASDWAINWPALSDLIGEGNITLPD